ncbi:MAG: YaiI/YqxD family protein [Clostridiales bacterium]|nr:YaiI/YqxD family protein [Clostridiales bacterium]
MKLIIDGDGCPVTDIVIKTGRKYKIPVLLICDTAHYTEKKDCETIFVSKGTDSADFIIINRAEQGDIVITQDYGLGAMCLGKNVYAINQNGFLYTAENIDGMLFRRHLGRQLRKGGARGSRIPKRKKEDDERFETCLIKLIDKITH